MRPGEKLLSPLDTGRRVVEEFVTVPVRLIVTPVATLRSSIISRQMQAISYCLLLIKMRKSLLNKAIIISPEMRMDTVLLLQEVII